MKMYMNDNCLRLVGKSWQIKAKLKELSKSPLTVHQYLQLSKDNPKSKIKEQIRLIRS